MEEPKNLKDLPTADEFGRDTGDVKRFALKQSAITHIKHMQREGRDGYYANIDEKSAIPWIKNFFGVSDEELE